MSATTSQGVQKLTDRARSFFDQAISVIPEISSYHRIRFICFRYPVPKDFTQEEFDSVGYAFTVLGWSWYELGKIGDPHWSYILDPET